MTDFEYLVLVIYALEYSVLALLTDFLGFGGRDHLSVLLFLESPNLLHHQSMNKFRCRTPLAIECLETVDEEFQEHVHLSPTPDDQVDVSVF